MDKATATMIENLHKNTSKTLAKWMEDLPLAITFGKNPARQKA
ncbi:MAG TPA: hypothetical protein VKB19_16300 [Pedobacter sp.]|nr:hypothetical protein [Pedobacter sp.]